QIREILISESAWEEMTCLFAPSLVIAHLNVKILMLVTSKISIDKLISDNDDVDGRWFLGVILSWHMDFAYPDE
ncbi:hypothetical protein KAF70_15100, partial [Klebsiella pneumoniae]|nr:hypothetical protein [Klebsiella pneumoniae]